MNASEILAAGQAFLAEQFPATVKIGAQVYNCACGGVDRSLDLGDGEGYPQRRVAFWIPVAAFEAAGEPWPRERSALYAPNPSDPSKPWVKYIITNVVADGTNTNLQLRCESSPS